MVIIYNFVLLIMEATYLVLKVLYNVYYKYLTYIL